MAWDCGAGHYFEFLLRGCLVLNIFPFPVSTAKLIGDFYNNRRSAANGYPRFAYSFVSLMLRQYYLSCDSYSANRRSTANKKKIRENFVLALRICTASPISTRCHVVPIMLPVSAIYSSANTISFKSLVTLHLFFQNSPIILAVLNGNGNKVKTRWRPPKTTKKYPAPRCKAHTRRIIPLSTHLSFR